jgi:hypothetical protein
MQTTTTTTSTRTNLLEGIERVATDVRAMAAQLAAVAHNPEELEGVTDEELEATLMNLLLAKNALVAD